MACIHAVKHNIISMSNLPIIARPTSLGLEPEAECIISVFNLVRSFEKQCVDSRFLSSKDGTHIWTSLCTSTDTACTLLLSTTFMHTTRWQVIVGCTRVTSHELVITAACKRKLARQAWRREISSFFLIRFSYTSSSLQSREYIDFRV